jgi:trans-aconitate methyltransferase
MEKNSLKWDAKLYQNNSAMQFHLGLMGIERLKPQDNESILEIGGGNGLLTIELSKLIPKGKITFIEISEDMIKQAKENFSNYNINNIEINPIDALKIKYENEFDAIFSNSAIHWIRDQVQIYKIMYKALRNKGRIMIQTGLKEMSAFIKAFLLVGKEFKEYLKDLKIPWHFLTIEETEAILKASHFKEIAIEKYEFIAKFENEENLINYCRAAGFVPFFNVIPETLHDKFVERYKTILYKINQPNPLNLQMNRLFISAKKIL